MKSVKLGVLGLVGAMSLFACSAKVSEGDAPDVALDGVGESDYGTSYGGWTQSPSGKVTGTTITEVKSVLTRSSGDATRGGGACIVARGPVYGGGGCSIDSDCQADAERAYGSEAWGYCVSGGCFARPGAQSALCVVNPNRTPGTLTMSTSVYGSFYNGYMNAIGCMTKTVGPNFACAGTDTTAYMRYLGSVTFN